MRPIIYVALLVVTAGALSCKQAADPTETTPADHPMRLGETIQLRYPALRVRADSLADSRCPTNVVCITAGTVVVSLTAEGEIGRKSFTMSLTGDTAENENNAPTVEVLSHSFRLRRVDPYPLAGTDVRDSDYRLILVAR